MTQAKGGLSGLTRLPQALRKMAADVIDLKVQVLDLHQGFTRIDRDLVAGLQNLSDGFQRLDAQLASGGRKPDDVARRSDIAALGQTMARMGDALTRLAEAQERTEQALIDLLEAVRGTAATTKSSSGKNP